MTVSACGGASRGQIMARLAVAKSRRRTVSVGWSSNRFLSTQPHGAPQHAEPTLCPCDSSAYADAQAPGGSGGATAGVLWCAVVCCGALRCAALQAAAPWLLAALMFAARRPHRIPPGPPAFGLARRSERTASTGSEFDRGDAGNRRSRQCTSCI